ncbi:hypothetical protein UA08_04652 [Talaromyces atroroseus]|uniref:FAD dependent oxidoreductase domain-containing protein n=1 Tax=Talaromyces atroroseus TaxID=1441469 RepID=A0A225AF43_TALAT|nr:hypothetical protein UA08_04652 [Talaromyces atroroseus]OKL59921.1 hypothetical protein UA08_04652 [Talaromyces atroroseus]
MPSKDASIIIVGAGVFGLTLAHELCKRGYIRVTVLDRHLPPVPDGSSVDISRVIRSDYADAQYMQMAIEAVAGWESEYSRYYHETGILIVSDDGGHSYLNKAKEQVQSQGTQISIFDDASQIRNAHREFASGTLQQYQGYLNPRAGWADSAEAIRFLAAQCAALGVSFVTGTRGSVESLVLDGAQVVGVNVREGPALLADHVILATGAWTPRLIDLTSSAVSTAQPVGFIQLTADEADRIRNMPIAIDFSSGFFVFPPTPRSNILKCARHGYGYETRVSGEQQQISAPELHGDGTRSLFLPTDAELSLREGLRRFFSPSISERPFVKKHLCWYTDTPQGDFIVDHHPDLRNLFLATGGSGHAFKFLPILGTYTCDVFEGSAPRALRQKWACRAGDKDVLMHGDGSRGGPPRRRLEDWEQLEFLGRT